MRTLLGLLALSCALLSFPALAYEETGFDLSLHYGADKYDALGLKSGIGGLKGSALLEGTSTHVGATAVYRGGLLELGVIGEIGRPGTNGSTTLLGALAGVGFGTALRLELLGELAAHRYGDLLKDASVLTRSRSEVWLVSAGLRPGLSMRFGPDGMVIVGVWAFARWDVTSENVQVTLASGNATYKLGGSQFGGSLRLGLAL